MFDAARVRLTLWYLGILAVIVGVLSFALYHVLVRFPAPAIPPGSPPITTFVAYLAAMPNEVLAWQIVAIDVGVLVLATVGAYLLAGKTLRPIAEAMARQQRFAAAASHELRTPLTVLQGSMEVALLRRRTPEEYEKLLRQSVAEVARMGALVADLLALVRAELDVDALRLTLVDLRDVARAAADEARASAAQRDQSLDVDLDGPLPVRADALKLRQAVSNLLDNAVKYTPHGGAIRLVARGDHRRALLQVRDTGPGIAERHVPHLFEPFYRVDATADHAAGHVGLGLAMASWIVRAHRGQITVESRVGLGTAFTIALPLAAPAGRATRGAAEAAKDGGLQPGARSRRP